METNEIGILGGALGALAFVARGLIEILKGKVREPQHGDHSLILQKLTSTTTEIGLIRKAIEQHTENDEKVSELLMGLLDQLHHVTTETLRIHRDAGSIFSTVETNKLLNELLKECAVLKAQIALLPR